MAEILSRNTGCDPEVPPPEAEEIVEVKEKIYALYNEGVPLFTKNWFADLCQQFEKNDSKGQKIWLKALDGSMVDFDVETGNTHPAWDERLEFIM